MKQKMILTVCLAVLGMLGVKAQQSIIALHHQGNVTIFAGAKTQEAMDASVKGDTLYLSEGTFAGFNVTHGIVVLGSGEKTVVSGNITITGNDEKKDLGGYVFSGLNMLHDFVVNDSVNGLRLSQCQMDKYVTKPNCVSDNVDIIMCYIKNHCFLEGEEYGTHLFSSKIRLVDYGGVNLGSVTFNHCNVNLAQDGDSDTQRLNTYINCIIGRAACSTFTNSIYNSALGDGNSSFLPNLYECVQADFQFDENMNCSLSDEELKAASYLGNDGTVVGITGGDIPYTLELAAPHVVDHKVEVDNVNRKMTVTLKMAHDANKKEEE